MMNPATESPSCSSSITSRAVMDVAWRTRSCRGTASVRGSKCPGGMAPGGVTPSSMTPSSVAPGSMAPSGTTRGSITGTGGTR
jgi:hypothetical protein